VMSPDGEVLADVTVR